MVNQILKRPSFACLLFLILLVVAHPSVRAQSTTALQGTVVDQSGAVVPGARVSVRNQSTGFERTTQTGISGRYKLVGLPVSSYRVEARADGWQTQIVENVVLEISQVTVRDFQLVVGDVREKIIVTDEAPIVESSTITVGQVVNQKTVQEIPLSGRHFVELGLLVAGSVTSPQDTTNLVTRTTRGQGPSGFHTAGNRAEMVNFMLNGINLNDMATNSIAIQASISSVREFKVDNSTFSAEYGRNAGAIVNIATRSGGNQFHGEAFEFFRNDALDARNFFDPEKPPFKRNQFGGAIGGPIKKNRTFFFFTYEGLRQRQQLTMNSGVLSDAQRAEATDPAVRKLVELIPRANAFVAGGPRFIGPAGAPSDLDEWSADVSHELTAADHLQVYYAIQRDTRTEPTDGSATIPNFGDVFANTHQVFTLNEIHTFGSNLVNEMRAGFSRINATIHHGTVVNPADFGIKNGIDEAIGLPQIIVDGIGLSFGGPITVPQTRADTTIVWSDTLNYLRGPHALKFGGEFRRFDSNLYSMHPGFFRFSGPAAFIKGEANQFSIVQGKRSSSIPVTAVGVFAQDNFQWRPNLRVELGLRYEWNGTQTERFNRFVVFDTRTSSLVRIGSGLDQVHHPNTKLQPRVGFAWDPFRSGKTSLRAAYALLFDQPTTFLVGGLTTNPPFATPLNFNEPGRTVRFDNAIDKSNTALAPATVSPDFDDAYVQSWNLNLQRELVKGLKAMVGYFGSKGTHLLIFRNLNQLTNGKRTFPQLSPSSPILPKTTLGNITESNSSGNSRYNALWLALNKRLEHGLQFSAAYTWSKSFDYNSLSRQGIVAQDSNNLRAEWAPSDFDARHRLVVNWLYELPWRGHRLKEGWQLSGITQLQSGSPINIVAGNPLAIPGTPIVNAASFTGTATLRPDVISDLRRLGKPYQWFTNVVCDPRDAKGCPAGAVLALPVTLQAGVSVFHFGNLGRNVVIGPGFSTTDMSLLKDTRLSEDIRLQLRIEIFDILNHANFGQPGSIAQVGSTSLGVISSTRFPTGDSGSSRQVQFAVKLMF